MTQAVEADIKHNTKTKGTYASLGNNQFIFIRLCITKSSHSSVLVLWARYECNVFNPSKLCVAYPSLEQK